ncbi:MAG: hypothetical protein FWE69_04845 [Clostridiales bacterium]|nr:hypothetical protein [Clostridiales bacterium]
MQSKIRKHISMLLAAAMAFGVFAALPLMANAAGFGTVPMPAAAYAHSLSLRSDGTVWAWGRNNLGQLGDGTDTERTYPAQIETAPGVPLSGVVLIATGGHHSLALKNDGTVWAWGYNAHGQLGNGTTVANNRAVPVEASPGTALSGVIAVAANTNHSLALKGDGTVWAWGRNDYGQLGDGTTMQSNSPVQVMALSGVPMDNVTAIAASAYHSLALKSDGTVYAWGQNTYGQLGDGTATDSGNPVRVTALPGVPLGDITAIDAGGTHCLALKDDGTVWAWGRNNFSQLGDGTKINRNNPVQVGGALGGVSAIAAGNQYSLVLKDDGTVWAWGNNGNGDLGDGSTTERNTPVQVMLSAGEALNGIDAIAAGSGHNLALRSDDTVWSWGRNDYRQLGDGSGTTSRRNPVQVMLSSGEALHLIVFGLMVAGGTGSGGFAAGATVTIMANAAPAGQRFKQWNISPAVTFIGGAGAASATAQFIMPAQAVTATALYEPIPTYVLTVVNGSGGGSYPAGTVVTITADAAPGGQVFDKWTASTGAVANENSASTGFTMPSSAAAVTAAYKDAPIQKQYFKLWSKVTRWEKTPLNWLLCICLFGWIWFVF